MRFDDGQGQGIVGGSIHKGALVLADCWRIIHALFFPMRTRPHFVVIVAMSSVWNLLEKRAHKLFQAQVTIL